jgi:flagellin-like hook-associated protein FlgL
MTLQEALSSNCEIQITSETSQDNGIEQATTTVEGFSGVANNLVELLSEMHIMAQDAAGGSYSYEELSRMQEELDQLAGQIDSSIEAMSYNDEILATGDDENVFITIDISNLDLRSDAESAAGIISEALNKISTYRDYLESKSYQPKS